MLLTDPAFIRRLESLYLLARKVLSGSLQADRRTTQKGGGVAFADYAEYTLGDDHRSIDWRVYARLEQMKIKLFELEEAMTLFVLVDCSPSMRSKFYYAQQLAAAITYIALSSMDRVAIYGFSNELRLIAEPGQGRDQVFRFLKKLQDAEPYGTDSRLNDCVRTFRARHRTKGMVVVISDFLFPQGIEEGLRFLLYHKHDVFCMQVQDEQDQRCQLKGDVDLECVETGARQRVTITSSEAAAYERAVQEWNENLRSTCARCGVGQTSTLTDVPFDDVIQYILRRGGLVA